MSDDLSVPEDRFQDSLFKWTFYTVCEECGKILVWTSNFVENLM